MSTKPKLYYFDGRGKMESIRWLLAAAGVEFEEEFLETRDQYEKLLQGGSLLFQQVPMVEMDGMKMVQTRAILSYIAAKYNLYGKDLKERALIDMYVGGTDDLMGFILMFPFLSAEDKEKQRALIAQKATSRYFPVYEKVWRRIIFFLDSGGITMGTLGVSPQPEAEVPVQYFTPEHSYCVLAGGKSEQYQIRWGGSTQETCNVFSSPCAGEEGSDTAALMDFWYPARVNPTTVIALQKQC
ncbi:glutathione S-transferase 3 isoform X1 [Camarhynchus parvulus]|uniref:glutathione S-transferase 3 isoform X1 n=1 Tax=Geospiza parvula TaxID=87175 RepID=UPI0012380002|nr:glutathione S-transferase 3 isoform X1 [Camarhynchus parvulus]XP_030802144.1 glutathione S-transferase 3 isoform X1 [Camarhynchus parvulus]